MRWIYKGMLTLWLLLYHFLLCYSLTDKMLVIIIDLHLLSKVLLFLFLWFLYNGASIILIVFIFCFCKFDREELSIFILISIRWLSRKYWYYILMSNNPGWNRSVILIWAIKLSVLIPLCINLSLIEITFIVVFFFVWTLKLTDLDIIILFLHHNRSLHLAVSVQDCRRFAISFLWFTCTTIFFVITFEFIPLCYL